MIFNTGLTHLGSEASISKFEMNKCSEFKVETCLRSRYIELPTYIMVLPTTFSYLNQLQAKVLNICKAEWQIHFPTKINI